MNATVTSLESAQPSHSSAFQTVLPPEAFRVRAPAVFAPAAHERMTGSYTFISSSQVLAALNLAGFMAVDARQSARAKSPLHARHLVRLRRRYETIQLRDSIPEILFLNSHDGTSAYQLRVGLYRVACTNGLVVSMGVFPVWRVMHRGDVVQDVVCAALRISERFEALAAAVDRMERTLLGEGDRLELARHALSLRFPNDPPGAMDAAQVLVPRRGGDVGTDLWRTFNVIQENVLRGGLVRRSPANRLTRTRGIRAIREDVRLNSALWEMAIARAV